MNPFGMTAAAQVPVYHGPTSSLFSIDDTSSWPSRRDNGLGARDSRSPEMGVCNRSQRRGPITGFAYSLEEYPEQHKEAVRGTCFIQATLLHLLENEHRD
jgi:hypothetical protein